MLCSYWITKVILCEANLRTYIHLYLLYEYIIQIIKNMGVLGLAVFAGGFRFHESS